MTFLDKLQPILPTTASTLNLFGKDCQKTSSSVLTVALRIFSVLSIPLTLITDIFLLPFRGYYYFTKQKNFTIKSTSKNPPEAAPSPRSLAPIAAPQTTAPWHKRLSETASQLRSFLPIFRKLEIKQQKV